MSTRNLALGTFALVLLAAPAMAAPLVDDIDNGGFEAWNGAAPANWTVLSGNVAQSSNAAAGSSALQINPGDGVVGAISQAVPNGDDDPPIVAGTWYEFDFAADLNTGSINGNSPTAQGVVQWVDATGAVVGSSVVPIAASDAYVSHAVTVQAPLPSPDHPVPVTSANVQFVLQRVSSTSRHDVNLFVDSVAFGPTTPPLPALPA